jgi:hypothetical protein
MGIGVYAGESLGSLISLFFENANALLSKKTPG